MHNLPNSFLATSLLVFGRYEDEGLERFGKKTLILCEHCSAEAKMLVHYQHLSRHKCKA